VEQAKVAFLFGEPPHWANPDNPEDRRGLLSSMLERDEETEHDRLAVYETVANQVADDDPPEVWQTARRLLGLGFDRRRVMRDLVMAMVPEFLAAATENRPYDGVAHKAALAALPLPTIEEVTAAMISVVRARQPLAEDELVAATAAVFNVSASQEPHRTLIKDVFRQAKENEDLEFVTTELVVEPSSFCARSVFTHRLTSDERDHNYLAAAVDLVCFEQAEVMYGPDGVEFEYRWLDQVGPAWQGPPGCLQSFPVGAVLAIRSNENGTSVFAEALATAPVVDDAAVVALRAVYDAWVEGLDLPISVKLLTLIALAENGNLFSEPLAPLRELLSVARLEHRDGEVAHAPEVWRRADEFAQYRRIFSRFADAKEAEPIVSAIELFNDGEWDNAKRMREVLLLMREDATRAEILANELLGPELDESSEIRAQAALVMGFAAALLSGARKPEDVAAAQWLMAMADERAGDVTEAEAHLRRAVAASGDWEPAVDRLAWYLSDKGEADEAARLWQGIGVDEDDPRLVDMEPSYGLQGRRRGRNDPCWCGSGRKYKICHLGQPVLPPLPERVRWLAGKGVSYLKRHSAEAAPDILDIAVARAGGGTSEADISRALSDPLTVDLVLNEGGWFEMFLEDRGSLLPSDEALLASAWTLVDRTIFEVLSVRPGEGVLVKDLRSAEEIEVRERTFSKRAFPGMHLCARAVPDGQSHQFLGGLFIVRTGTEAALLELLDEADPEAIAAWAAALDSAQARRHSKPPQAGQPSREAPGDEGPLPAASS
jgi:SEC-C motif